MRVVFFVLLLAVLAACTDSNSIPSGILSRQQMETVVWQLMQSDEYVNTLLTKDSTKKASVEKMKVYQQVFDLNGTSLEIYKKSYQFYMLHPDITKVMFDSINTRAGRQRADLYKSKMDTSKPKPMVVVPVHDTLSAVSLRPYRHRDSLRAAHALLKRRKDSLKPAAQRLKKTGLNKALNP